MATPTINASNRTAAPSLHAPSEKNAGHSPYGLPIVDSCVGCGLRQPNSFCMLSQRATEDLDGLKHVSFYPPGAVIFMEGQAPRGVYVVCQGRAKLTSSNAAGKSLILRIAQPGTMVGMNACINGKPYDTTLETLQPSQLAFIRREDFLGFLNHQPEACLHAAQHLACDCQSAYEVIRSIGLSHSMPEKLARILLQWSTDTALINGTIRLKLRWTHEELAQFVGTSRETVTRTLSDLKKQGILEVSGATLFIRDKAALENLINK
jgi:CRP/FNR family transcriptional regulator, cyclic AMP receptor protein